MMKEKEIRLEGAEIRFRPVVPAGSSLVLSDCRVISELDFTAIDLNRLEIVNTRIDKPLILDGAFINELVVDSSTVDTIRARQLMSHSPNRLRIRCRNTSIGIADFSHGSPNSGFNAAGCKFGSLLLDDIGIESGGINLACCIVENDLDMRQASIHGEADFAGLTVKGNADLRDAVFSGWFDASRSVWHGFLDTSRPLARTSHRLSGASADSATSDGESFQFRLGCDFLGAIFYGPVRMIRSSFGGDLIFLEAKASPEASIDLRGASVAGTLDASRVLSKAKLDLGDSSLDHFISAGSAFQEVRMDGAKAKILVEFHNIKITGDLSLKNLKVTGMDEDDYFIAGRISRRSWMCRNSLVCRRLIPGGSRVAKSSSTALPILMGSGAGKRSYRSMPRGLRLFVASIGGQLDLTRVDLPSRSFQFADIAASKMVFEREKLAPLLKCQWEKTDDPHRLNGLMYRTLKEALRKEGHPKDEDWALYLEIREMNLSNYHQKKREEHLLRTPIGLLVNIGFFHLFWRLACGFGLRLPNLLLSSFLFIILFGLLYHAFPQQFVSVDETTRAHQMDEQEPQNGSESDPMYLGMPWLSSFYFSAGTFTSLGSNTTAFLQWGLIGIFVIIESFLGVFMMTVFVGAAIRKILRTA
jgi:hypothetical protein